jgi:N-acyl-D-glucosamine 2-epimerase
MQPSDFVSAARTMLTDFILPFWMTRMLDPRGGFYGRIDGLGNVHPEAEKGAILNARILWTFSAAYRILGEPAYLYMATRAKCALLDNFFDPEYGGVYWSLNPDGTPRDTKKQIYALGFAIYGLSEYARATGDKSSLAHAMKLFFDIENHSFDTERNGYFEAFTREWGEIADMRLSDKDANERKTMNTHLHILEPYTNLYRVWPDARLAAAIRNLIDIFIDRILDPQTFHLRLFFDDDWNSKVDATSYGHDIEASWLIHEAALVLGDEALLARVEPVVHAIAQHADYKTLGTCLASEQRTANSEQIIDQESNEGQSSVHCSLITDHSSLNLQSSIFNLQSPQWWEYAETVVGYYNVWQHFGDAEALDRALKTWDFIESHLVDRQQGEWFWSVTLPDYAPNRAEDKAGFWKCPYHNSRACLELIERPCPPSA